MTDREKHYIRIDSHHNLLDLKLREVWRYRDLIWLFTKRSFQLSYKQTVLGPVWLFISPIFSSVVYTILFTDIAKISTEGIPAILFYMVSNAVWGFFSSSLAGNASAFTANAGIFGKVYFPRLVMPVANVLSGVIRMGIHFIVTTILLIYFIVQGLVSPHWWALPLIPAVLIWLGIMGMSCGIIVSSLTTKYRDLSVFVGFGMTLWMYATPVVYPISQVTLPWLNCILLFNSVTMPVEIFRYALRGVKKKYRLGRIGGGTLKADIESRWALFRGKEDPNTVIGDKRKAGDTFMALNGIDLDIYEGEAVGIIGRNGAGKSTLLKLLSRVTAPTDGVIEMWGRVTSMLEVGTGFHGEMTGRENIYMNGSILGMTKAEIDAKIEDIIEFSEVRDSIDTPVKRYSSGMFVKLAFSVAAHLDSEIMIMDEVLAVGDVVFQKKCLAKMREAAGKQGRTVLYVSHNMNTIRQLCDRCVVMDEGKIVFDGDVEKAIALYTAVTPQKMTDCYIYDKTYHNDLWKHPDFTIEELRVKDRNSFVFDCGEQILLLLSVTAMRAFGNVKIRLEFSDMNETKLGSMWSKNTLNFTENEQRQLNININPAAFTPGQYKVDIVVFITDAYGEDHFLDGVYPGFYMEISDKINGANPFVWHREWWGALRMKEFEID